MKGIVFEVEGTEEGTGGEWGQTEGFQMVVVQPEALQVSAVGERGEVERGETVGVEGKNG